jgi:hypothetical protein
MMLLSTALESEEVVKNVIFWHGVLKHTECSGRGVDLVDFQLRMADAGRLAGIGHCPSGKFVLAGAYDFMKESLTFQMRDYAGTVVYGDFHGVVDIPRIIGGWQRDGQQGGGFQLSAMGVEELRRFNRRYLRLPCDYDGSDLAEFRAEIAKVGREDEPSQAMGGMFNGATPFAI